MYVHQSTYIHYIHQNYMYYIYLYTYVHTYIYIYVTYRNRASFQVDFEHAFMVVCA